MDEDLGLDRRHLGSSLTASPFILLFLLIAYLFPCQFIASVNSIP